MDNSKPTYMGGPDGRPVKIPPKRPAVESVETTTGTVNLGALKEMARDARGDSERELQYVVTRSAQEVGYQEALYLVCREYIMHHENIRRVERIARECDAMDKMYRIPR